LTVADLGLLAAWCVAWSDFVAAETALTLRLVVNGKDGHPVRSPWVIVKYKAIEAMVKIGDRMGFSPSARVSLAAPKLPHALGATDRTPRRGSLAEYLSQKPDTLD
jgi:P27 family predicted phage terminase small subunit